MSDHPFQDLENDLAAVRLLVEEASRHHGSRVGEMAEYFVSNLGQMLRPSLVLASSRLGGEPPGEAARSLAALVELVHAASLLHDDVIDRADTRRGRTAAHHLFGEAQSVLLGDLLLAHGLRLLAPHATPPVLDTLSRITRDLAAGQLLELRAEKRTDPDVENYLRIIELKTATFFGYCARLGAQAAGLPEEDCRNLDDYGRRVGFAYQILDDLLDVSATGAGLGKPVGADLENGRMTLPLLRHLESEGPGGPVREALQAGRLAELGEEIPGLIRRSGAFDRVLADARGYCEAAREVLDGLGAREHIGPLHVLLDYLFRRLAALTLGAEAERSAAQA